MKKVFGIGFISFALIALCLGAAYAQVTNGGFETGDFTGWTQNGFFNEAGGPTSGGPNFTTFLDAQAAGVTTADSNAVEAAQTSSFDGLGAANTTISPVQGSFLAFVTNATSEGNSTLTGSSISQAVAIPPGATTLTLSLRLLNNDSSESFAGYDDFGGVALSQGSTILAEYNADLDPASTADLHITADTNEGGFLNSTPWTTVTFDVSAYQGQTITLTAYSLQYGGDNSVETRLLLDNIVLNAPVSSVPVPTLSSTMLILLMGLLFAASIIYMRRKDVRA